MMATDDKTKKSITMMFVPRKDALPEQSPYANATFTFVNNEVDITICFLRQPLLDDDAMKPFIEPGEGKLEAVVACSVTLPRLIALGLANKLKEMLGG